MCVCVFLRYSVVLHVSSFLIVSLQIYFCVDPGGPLPHAAPWWIPETEQLMVANMAVSENVT